MWTPISLSIAGILLPTAEKKPTSITKSLIILEPNEPTLDFDLLYSSVLANLFEVC